MTKYSFIVPHHNNPVLLNRLIDSIPQRNDVEIIVVDDASQDSLKPSNLRSDCTIIQIPKSETKGAGHARNVGLSAANGTWLLFPDCDDFYECGILDTLDSLLDDSFDLLYFDVYYTWNIKEKRELCNTGYHNSIKQYLKEPSSVKLGITVKHIIQPAWNFAVKKSHIDSINAQFEEVSKGNDAYFHHYVALNTSRFKVSDKKLYYWIWNDNSISHKKRTKDEVLKNVYHTSKIIDLRIKANAWNTIKPFFIGLKKNLSYGVFFVVKLYLIKFFLNNWPKIWMHKVFNF